MIEIHHWDPYQDYCPWCGKYVHVFGVRFAHLHSCHIGENHRVIRQFHPICMTEIVKINEIAEISEILARLCDNMHLSVYERLIR